MEDLDRIGTEIEADDLARRLARYRRRVEAEGRKRSLRVIDRAIGQVDDERGSPAGK